MGSCKVVDTTEQNTYNYTLEISILEDRSFFSTTYFAGFAVTFYEKFFNHLYTLFDIYITKILKVVAAEFLVKTSFLVPNTCRQISSLKECLLGSTTYKEDIANFKYKNRSKKIFISNISNSHPIFLN